MGKTASIFQESLLRSYASTDVPALTSLLHGLGLPLPEQGEFIEGDDCHVFFLTRYGIAIKIIKNRYVDILRSTESDLILQPLKMQRLNSCTLMILPGVMPYEYDEAGMGAKESVYDHILGFMYPEVGRTSFYISDSEPDNFGFLPVEWKVNGAKGPFPVLLDHGAIEKSGHKDRSHNRDYYGIQKKLYGPLRQLLAQCWPNNEPPQPGKMASFWERCAQIVSLSTNDPERILVPGWAEYTAPVPFKTQAATICAENYDRALGYIKTACTADYKAPVYSDEEEKPAPTQAKPKDYEVCQMGSMAQEGQEYAQKVIAANKPMMVIDRSKTVQGVLVPLAFALSVLKSNPSLRRVDMPISKLRTSFRGLRELARQNTAVILCRYKDPALAYLSKEWIDKASADIEKTSAHSVVENDQKLFDVHTDIANEKRQIMPIELHGPDVGLLGYMPQHASDYIQKVITSKKPLIIVDRAQTAQGVLVPLSIAAAVMRDTTLLQRINLPVTKLRFSFKTIREYANNGAVVILCNHKKPALAYLSREWIVRACSMVEEANSAELENFFETIIGDKKLETADVAPTEFNGRETGSMGYMAQHGQEYAQKVITTKTPLIIVDRKRTAQGVLVPLSVAAVILKQTPSLQRVDLPITKLRVGFKAVREQAKQGAAVILCQHRKPALVYLAGEWISQAFELAEKATDADAEMFSKVEMPAKKTKDARRAKISEAFSASADSATVYMREAGKKPLLLREEEVALAKRLETGKHMLFGALCESPQAIKTLLQWHNALQDGSIRLRDVIDMMSTDLKNPGHDSEDESDITAASDNAESEEDTLVATKEEELKPKVLAAIVEIEQTHSTMQKLKQEKDSPTESYEMLKRKMAGLMETISLTGTRIDLLLNQLLDTNRELTGLDGRMFKPAQASGIERDEFAKHYYGFELDTGWPQNMRIVSPQWGKYTLGFANEISGTKMQLSAIGEKVGLPLSDFRRIVSEAKQGLQQADAAKKEMVESNLRLVAHFARKYEGQGLPYSDLVQEGNIGLMKAVDRFDYRLGYKFATYASWWIRQSMSRAISDHGATIRIPVHMGENIRKVRRAMGELKKEHGHSPSPEELAQHLNMPLKTVHTTLQAFRKTVSLETPVGDEEDSVLGDFIKDENDQTFDIAAQASDRRYLERLLAHPSLKKRERDVLHERYLADTDGETRTFEEVSAIKGVTRERVRQIEEDALSKLFAIATKNNAGPYAAPFENLGKERPKISMHGSARGVIEIKYKKKPKIEYRDGFGSDDAGRTVGSLGLVSKHGANYLEWVTTEQKLLPILDRIGDMQGLLAPTSIATALEKRNKNLQIITRPLQHLRTSFKGVRAEAGNETGIIFLQKGNPAIAYFNASWANKIYDISQKSQPDSMNEHPQILKTEEKTEIAIQAPLHNILVRTPIAPESLREHYQAALNTLQKGKEPLLIGNNPDEPDFIVVSLDAAEKVMKGPNSPRKMVVAKSSLKNGWKQIAYRTGRGAAIYLEADRRTYGVCLSKEWLPKLIA